MLFRHGIESHGGHAGSSGRAPPAMRDFLDREGQIFCRERYRLSFQLPTIARERNTRRCMNGIKHTGLERIGLRFTHCECNERHFYSLDTPNDRATLRLDAPALIETAARTSDDSRELGFTLTRMIVGGLNAAPHSCHTHQSTYSRTQRCPGRRHRSMPAARPRADRTALPYPH
jgi:hypothetical protein